MITNANEVSRRGFLAALGAASALPLFPAMAQQPGPGHWTETAGFHLASLRAAYAAEIARFAATLRPGFESGMFRAHADRDEYGSGKKGPQDALHARVVAHFGLEVTKTKRGEWVYYDGNEDVARSILASSPHAAASEAFGEAPSVCSIAADAALWDVIAHARAEGWYTPAPDECADPLDEEVLS